MRGHGVLQSTEIFNFLSLLLVGAFLTFIFVALAFNIALSNENKIKGFGYAILLWLFLAIVYDGLFQSVDSLSKCLIEWYFSLSRSAPITKTMVEDIIINPIFHHMGDTFS